MTWLGRFSLGTVIIGLLADIHKFSAKRLSLTRNGLPLHISPFQGWFSYKQSLDSPIPIETELIQVWSHVTIPN
jgi:hypothetical protein